MSGMHVPVCLQGITAFHFAAQNMSPEVVQLLLMHGARPMHGAKKFPGKMHNLRLNVSDT